MTVRSPHPALAAIALGSNLGRSEAHFHAALDGLARAGGVDLISVSEFVSTPPVGPPGQRDYLNAVCLVRTTRSPLALLALMRRTEARRGRDRVNGQRWGPRTLDLDLLLYDGVVMRHPRLILPHPRLHERRFVLEPLSQVAPDLVVPTLRRSVRELLADLDQSEAVT